MTEVACQRLPRDLGQRAGQLDTRGSAADDDEREQRARDARHRLALGALEREQHAPPDLERVFERLQAGRHRRHSSWPK